MANSNQPYGLRPLRRRDGAPYVGPGNLYFIPSTDATAVYVGDPVQIAGSADANGIATVTRATAAGGNYIAGVVVGFVPDQQIPLPYRAASTNRYVLVEDASDVLWTIQEDSVGGNLAAADIGLNADLASGSGSTVTGLSGFVLDTSTKATTNTLQLRLEGFEQAPDNDLTGAYQRALVSINLHQSRNLTGI